MKTIQRALPLTAILLASTAIADSKTNADACLREKIWAGYADNWAVRTATNTTLAAGEHKIYLVTLYAGNEYKFLVCSDSADEDIDLALHDASGAVMKHDNQDSNDPAVEYTPDKTDTFYVAVYAQTISGDNSDVSMAVTYR